MLNAGLLKATLKASPGRIPLKQSIYYITTKIVVLFFEGKLVWFSTAGWTQSRNNKLQQYQYNYAHSHYIYFNNLNIGFLTEFSKILLMCHICAQNMRGT